MLVAYSMYVLGLLIAILVAFVIHLIDKKNSAYTLLIELPEYKAPSGRTVFIYVWEKVKDYLTKAGTTIFIASIIMWCILNFGPTRLCDGYCPTALALCWENGLYRYSSPSAWATGRLWWRSSPGISAKEVVVSSCSVLFGVSNITTTEGMASLTALLGGIGFGALNAYALMTFSLLYIPCVATLATIHRESGSWKWTGMAALFQLVLAWCVTFLVYQIGGLFV